MLLSSSSLASPSPFPVSERVQGSSAPLGIDPRGPRYVAAMTSVILAVAFVLALTGDPTAAGPAGERVSDPGFLAVAAVAALFLWGAASPATAPWNVVFRRVIEPRLSTASNREDPRPPRFSQGVGLAITGLGLVLHLLGVPWALSVAAGMAFVAAFLNASIGFCLGCQLWMLLQRAGIVGRRTAA